MVDNKRTAKNAMALFLRMLISMIVSLYTSRVILDVLGIEEYGVYNVVGGITASFIFLNSSMSGATSRFITFALGKSNKEELNKTFCTSVNIHFGVALIVLILSETLGLWFLNNKLIIPSENISAANWVYQCSILSLLVSITQVPYNACIIAHEKMGVYAYVEILNVFLKLGIVYLLVICSFNKLIIYGILVLIVSIIIALVYRIYCISNFNECRYRYVNDKRILLPMLKFSGWDFYGNMCVTARNQGSTILLNMFFGVAVNSAAGIATTVYSTISGFAGNVMTAFRPQIIKLYSQSDFAEFRRSISNAAKFNALVMAILGIPVFLNADFILDVWLVEVPEYSSLFVRICLIASFFVLLGNPLITGIHSTGHMMKISFITGTLNLINLGVAYWGTFFGFGVGWIYTSNAIFNVLFIISNACILKYQCKEFSCVGYFLVQIRVVIVTIIGCFLVHKSCMYISAGLHLLVCECIMSLVLISILAIVFILNKQERVALKQAIQRKLGLKK